LNIEKRKIAELVDENFCYASILYYLGIRFYNYKEATLSEACKKQGLDIKQVVKKLKSVQGPIEKIDPSLFLLPIDLIIEYLKQDHHEFVKKRLPYISNLIKSLDPVGSANHQLVEDLKFIFPLFIEDYIFHIYEEEDTLFDYILQLKKAMDTQSNLADLYYQMEDNALQAYAVHHEMHDDGMAGIRKITNQYSNSDIDIHLKVVYEELKSFEKELTIHAKVENEILFPKSLMLEKRVKALIEKRINLN
jgi:regulator of cell morphogenesis and NO signaling